MNRINRSCAPKGARVVAFVAVLSCAFMLPAFAQDGVTDAVAPEIENRSDQLDVPFVPSTTAVLDAMFEFTKPNKDDYVMDLGSGDGRIVSMRPVSSAPGVMAWTSTKVLSPSPITAPSAPV